MITKIKYDKEVVEIHTSQSIGDKEEEKVIKSYEKPHPDLGLAFDDATKAVYEILGLPVEWAAGGVRVTGVSVSENQNGAMGAVLTVKALVPGSDSAWCFNTPHLFFNLPEGFGSPKTMSAASAVRVEKIIDEASEFLAGKSAQKVLPGVA